MNVQMRFDVPGALELPDKPSSNRRRNRCPFALRRQNSARAQWWLDQAQTQVKS
jgi:hypothetical protein